MSQVKDEDRIDPEDAGSTQTNAPALPDSTAPSGEYLRTPALAAASDPLVGKTVGGCEILSLIGRGAMGTVYRAKQLSLERIVALKTIREDYCADKHFLQRFRLEAKAVGRFNSRHVVQIHEVGLDQGIHFILMEYVDGTSLKGHAELQPGGRLSSADALSFLPQAAEGLLEAEKLKVIHRDIKPGNLLLDASGRVKIADFGIAKLLAAEAEMSMTATTGALGTPLYMSPEQASGGEIDHRSDMYSLGATFFQLLTGARPVEGESIYEVIKNKSIINYLSPARIAAAAEIPQALSSIIEKMTALHAEDRYASFKDLIEDLERVKRGLEPRAVPPPEGGQARPRAEPVPNRKALLMKAAILLLALGALGYGSYRYFGSENRKLSFVDGKKVEPKIDVDPSDVNPRDVDPVMVTDPRPEPLPKFESERVKALAQRFASDGGTVALLEDAAKIRRAIIGDSDEARAVRAETDVLIEAVGKGELRKLRSRLEKEGPRLQLFDDARALRRAVPAELPGTSPLASDTDAFLNDLSEVESRMEFLGNRPITALTMSPPFAEATAHWRTVAPSFDPPAGSAPEVGAWLAGEKTRHVDALWAAVAAAVKPLVERLSAALERFEAWDNGSDFEALLQSLEESGATLENGLPEGKTRWSECFPPELARKYRSAVEARQALIAWLASTPTEIERLEKQLDVVKSSLEWPRVDADLRPALEKLEAAVESKKKTAPPAKLAKAVESLERVRSSRDAWIGRASALVASLEKMAAGDLAGATALLEAPAGGPVIDAAAKNNVLPAIAAARKGFSDIIDRLDPRGAAESFAEARKLLEMPGGAGGAVAWLERCAKRTADLALSARGMVRIRGGRVRYNLEGGAFKDVEVKGFFLDRFEVSNREYAAFVASQDAVRDFEEVKTTWDGKKDIFNQFRRGPTYLKGAGVEPTLPVEEVNYYQAAAFLRSRGKSLPSLAEWWLAARGPAGREIDGIPCRDVQRNRPKARPVERGGTARNLPDDPGSSVHHLSGNVAEWCEVEGEKARDTRLVGGSYRDKEDRKFTGEVREKRSLDEAQEGFGMRGVLRPEAFLQGLLPQGKRD